MAINAPTIRPDPTGEYQRAFQTADTSARAYAALALERQKMEADAIQRARENKANDFKMMMQALERPDKLKQAEIENKMRESQLQNEAARTRIAEQSLGQQQFANVTARMNADASIAKDKPISLASYLGETDGASATDNPPPPALQKFTEPPLPMDGPASGDPTAGELGAKKTGVNEPSILLGDTPPPEVVPMLPTPDIVPAPPPTPTPTSTLRGLPDIVGTPAVPAATTVTAGQDAFASDVGLSPDLRPPEAPRVPGPQGATGPPGVAALPPAMTPPVPESIAATRDAAIRSSTQKILDLQKQSSDYATKAAKAAENVTLLRQAARYPQRFTDSEKIPGMLSTETQKQSENELAAVTTAAEMKKAREDQTIVVTRLNSLGSLKGIESVLPEKDYAELLKTIQDPTTGTMATEQILKLADYKRIRDQNGYTYKSRGIDTATRVAEVGAMRNGKEGQALNTGAKMAKAYDDQIAKLGPRTAENSKILDDLMKERMKYAVQANDWTELDAQYTAAVIADKRPDAPPPLPPVGGNGMRGAREPAPALPEGVPGGVAENAPWKEFAPKGAESDQVAASAFWNAGKNSASEAGQLAQAPTEVLNDIINRRPPSTGANLTLGGRFDVRTSAVATPISTTIAERIKGAFKMPEGSNDPRLTGRSADSPPTVEDFLIEAAKAELAKRGVKTTGGGTQTPPISAGLESLGKKFSP